MRLQTFAIEQWLEAERDQLVLWLPVFLGAGVILWFALPDPRSWTIAILLAAAIATFAIAFQAGGRLGRCIAVGGFALAAGVALIWWRAERAAAPVLPRATVVRFEARVERAQPLPARALVRLTLAPTRWLDRVPENAPTRIRVNLAEADSPAGIAPGAIVAMRARLMPPAPPAVPGAYDFERAAWFDSLGATGRGLAPVSILSGERNAEALRVRLSRHIHQRVEGSAGGIAAALATGDTSAIADADAEAMRRSGLAHLLAVSGLHVSAAVGIAMLLASRLFALNTRLALSGRVPLLAGAVGALAAIGYTFLTGAQVPTIRSCVAALLVLTAMALGREAVTLRLVATGAFVVLLLWPETLVGPSFQLSFAAVTTIVALHEHPAIRRWFMTREEGWIARLLRNGGSLLLTGLVIEFALMPIAIYHFHRAGIYGAVANIAAIPLTTLVVMPLEALALLFDAVGLGAPLWWLAGKALALLLWIARTTVAAPGSVTALPAMPGGAYALMAAGGLWLALWRTRWRRLGFVPLAIGAGWALATPAPDLLLTGDGRHVAIRTVRGDLAVLRDRTGEYVRGMLAENAGFEDDPLLLSEQPDAQCSRDACVMTRVTGGREWRILATRSGYLPPWEEMVAACRAVDIVISDRRLPRACAPRWLLLDRPTLEKTGGVALSLAVGKIVTVRKLGDRHPWVAAATTVPSRTRRPALRYGDPRAIPVPLTSEPPKRVPLGSR
ncbi:MAG: ComEC/Rec2 family competence protein [Candidatus Sphingomonas colombiensis]|nr:ComEC/Rec2 family competence protein [Sphingomonas sp.]WEK43022.1 MAG: ComEC/Rec2 family competence protein [Sphingomonas sp.]